MRGEGFLLCMEEDIEKVKEIYVKAMKSEMEVFISRGEIGTLEVEIPLSRWKCYYEDINMKEKSLDFEQPLEIFFSTTSTLSGSSPMVFSSKFGK